MRQMSLPHFLILIALVVVCAGLTIWAVAASGQSFALIGVAALVLAGVARLASRVE